METVITIQQQIEILQKALTTLKARNAEGICEAIRKASIDILPESFPIIPLCKLIPLFTHTNAEQFHANTGMLFWWPIGKNEDRIKFLNWMIKQLEKDLNT